jgi:serine/threonine protein kinase
MTTPNPDPFDLVGTTIAGKYDVDQVVAKTALSVVYRATHRVWQRSVAIKAFTAPLLSEESRQQLLASFVEEGRLLMDLSERCAAICQARDVSSLTTASGEWVPYTVLEWLDGECLEIVMRRERAEGVRPRTLAEAIGLLHPIADALAIAHERGVVHRDVKPGNIFLIQDGHDGSLRTKLLDFGVAKVLRGATVAPAGLAVSQSFTPSYGAPEQFSSAYGTTGPWTDVFALALIIVELLAGHEALEGEDVGTLGLQSCDASRRPTPRTLGAVVGDDVELVLGRALAVNPEDRYFTVREFWDSLLAALVTQDGADIEITWDAEAEDPSSAEVDALLSVNPPAPAPRESFPSQPGESSGPRESFPSQPPLSAEPRDSYPSQPPSSDDPRATPTSLVGATLPFGINMLRNGASPTPLGK